MSETWLILETSSRGGYAGLAINGTIHESALDPERRHNRDLAPTITKLLKTHGLLPQQVTGIMVSMGPGSFTGLRVGVMSAKVFAYATSCQLIAVPTFAAIAAQTPSDSSTVDVIADALKGLIYVQSYQKAHSSEWVAVNELQIVSLNVWMQQRNEQAWVTGPGLSVYDQQIPPNIVRTPMTCWQVRIPALAQVGYRIAPLSREQIFELEPLYLRPSSAEEVAARRSQEITNPPGKR